MYRKKEILFIFDYKKSDTSKTIRNTTLQWTHSITLYTGDWDQMPFMTLNYAIMIMCFHILWATDPIISWIEWITFSIRYCCWKKNSQPQRRLVNALFVVLLRTNSLGDSISDCSERTALNLSSQGIILERGRRYACLGTGLQGIIEHFKVWFVLL